VSIERGAANVLRLEETEVQASEDDEVLLRVRAAGEDVGVWHLMTGLPCLTRSMGYARRAIVLRI
jgi:hypothetical protein